MPLNADTSWVHSNSRDNKNPDRDLGGVPSKFELSIYPMNNLFDNISPKEARDGMNDYRCFYIFNKDAEKYIRNISLTMNQVADGSSIEFGSKLSDEVQKLVITPFDLTETPDLYGYIIVDTGLGQPLTVYWSGSIAAMAADFEAKLRKLPMCDACTVTGSGWTLTVTFTGDAGRRYMDPMLIVANRLDSTNGGSFRMYPGGTLPSQKCTGDLSKSTSPPQVAFNKNITSLIIYPPVDPDSFSASGTAWSFNKCLNSNTGGFQQISYTSLVSFSEDSMQLNLTSAIGYYIEEQDEVYIEPKQNDKFIVAVRKVTDGSPINTTAQNINIDTEVPSNIVFGTGTFSLPWLMPLEGFPLWVKRITLGGTSSKRHDGFDFTLTGDSYI